MLLLLLLLLLMLLLLLLIMIMIMITILIVIIQLLAMNPVGLRRNMSAQKDVIVPLAFYYTEHSGQLIAQYNHRNQHARTPAIFHRHHSFSAGNASSPVAFEPRPLQARVINP